MRITVKQYQDIQNIDASLDKMDQDITKLSIVYNKPPDYFELLKFKVKGWRKWFTSDLSTYINLLPIMTRLSEKPRRVVWINGTRYKLIDKFENENNAMLTDTWLALVHYRESKAGLIPNLHNILAWIYRPTFAKHNPEHAAKDFRGAKMHKVYGGFFLFLRQYRHWKVKSDAYNLSMIENLEKHMRKVIPIMTDRAQGV